MNLKSKIKSGFSPQLKARRAKKRYGYMILPLRAGLQGLYLMKSQLRQALRVKF